MTDTKNITGKKKVAQFSLGMWLAVVLTALLSVFGLVTWQASFIMAAFALAPSSFVIMSSEGWGVLFMDGEDNAE